MASIENRIVQMQFDNTSFERRLSETLKSLDKLDATIANAGAKNGLATLEDSVRGFNLGPISSSIEGVSAGFLALSTIAVTALSTIVSKAIDTGAKVISSLSLTPVLGGFEEYQTQIGAIQTILSNTDSKGTTLDEVNSALDQLNEYSDKTIYNFTEMTRNIGTFTAAGVGLDDSVRSIKGIANLAALSGSSSQQASTAMYQLSQAIATGSVKLMDWNSVVNAGMGGEIFQKALFETGKAMQTIEGVDLGTTFEEWTSGGNSFRGSLEKGWLTADVLTQTLTAFTGELDAAQLQALGYTEEQAQELARLGEIGVDAATKVRTLRGLLDTTKEALGSGWAQSFRIIFGDFEQATELFTGISNAVNGIIGQSADARNALLGGWAELGGRMHLIHGIHNAFKALGEILAPIKEAFAQVFPPLTAERLNDLTVRFAELMEALRPSEQTVDAIKRIFVGFFGALDIGREVIKEVANFIGELLGSFSGAGSGKFLEFAAKIGDFFADLSEKLVVSGRIAQFFDDLPGKVQPVIERIMELKDTAFALFDEWTTKAQPVIDTLGAIGSKVGEFFGSVSSGGIEAASEATSRFGQRFEQLQSVLEKIGNLWGPLKTAFEEVVGVLDEVWTHISTWFSELGTKLAEVFGPGDFDAVVDAVNVGLLGGILGILVKFFKDGFKFDLGSGFFEGITGAFEQLTGVLSAMETNIKADALMKIATAIGLLTASVLVLSLIDSAALTKALTAMAIGFGQLIASFAALNAIASGPKSAASLTILATGLIALAGAMLIMSAAVAIMSTMDWDEMGKGMAGIGGALTILIGAAKLLSGSSSGMISAGAGMVAMGLGLTILAGAVKLFSLMSWSDMAKGAVGIGGGLVIIAGAMQLMPPNLPLTAVGLMVVAGALSVLAGAVMLFATMSWSEMAKGAAGIAGGLVIIAGAMNLMPPTLPLIGVGLILVATSLGIISKALQSFAGMSWSEMGRGLAGMAGALLILAAATAAMSGSIVGAVAIGVVSGSLMLLVTVVKEFAKLKISDLIKGLGGLAAVLGILGGAALLLAPVTPALLGLGAALLVVGAGFALFGAGAYLVARAFEVIADVGQKGLDVLIGVMDAVIIRIPQMVQAFAVGLIELAQVFIDAAPVLIDGLRVVLEHILTTIIELMPVIGEAISAIITTLITLIREKVPEFIQLGYDLLISFLSGIRDNIGEIVTIALEILTNFLNGLAENLPMVIDAAANVIIAYIDGIARKLDDIIDAGLDLLISFLTGITNGIDRVATAVGTLITEFIDSVVELYVDLATAGVDALIAFLSGIGDNLIKVANSVTDIIVEFTDAMTKNANKLRKAGFDALIDFLKGISDNLINVGIAVTSIIISFINSLGANSYRITRAGVDAIIAFLDGLGKNALRLANGAAGVIIDFINGLAVAIDRNSRALRDAGWNLAVAIINGATFGLWSHINDIADYAIDVFRNAVDGVLGFLGIGSPSKVFIGIGDAMMEGASVGILGNSTPADAAISQIDKATTAVRDSLDKMTANFSNIADIQPTITPVLDLTQVQRDATQLSTLIPSDPLVSAGVSALQAGIIAEATRSSETDTDVDGTSKIGDITFEQNIYAPEQLSVGEIYRQTRTQLSSIKQELGIP